MFKLESVSETEMRKILWNFQIETDHPIQGRKQFLILVNNKKRNCHQMDFAVSAYDS